MLFAIVAAGIAPPAEAGWTPDSLAGLDVFRPDELSYDSPGASLGTLRGTSIRVNWNDGAGCWNPRDYLTTKNLSYWFKRPEFSSGPTCTDGAITSCTVTGSGAQGSTPVSFQVTMAAIGGRCGQQAMVTGSAADLAAHKPLLAALANGFAAPGTKTGPAVAVAPKPTEPTPAVPALPTPAAPDLGRKVPGPCSASYVERLGKMATDHRQTWTWDGERLVAWEDTITSGDGKTYVFKRDAHEYDAAGRRTRTVHTESLSSWPIEYTYDDAGRLIRETTTMKSGSVFTKTHEYDAQGRLVLTKDGLGDTAREYDAQGRLSREGPYTVTWSDDGRIERHAFVGSHGVSGSRTRVYDAHGNLLTDHEIAMIDSREYTYDYGCWVR